MSPEVQISPKSPSEKPNTIGLDPSIIDRLKETRAVLREHTRDNSRWNKIDLYTIRGRTTVPPHSQEALDDAAQARLIGEVRGLIKKTVFKPERDTALEEAGITPELIKHSKNIAKKEMAATAGSTVASEGASYGAGWASTLVDLQDKIPVHNPWIIGGLVAASYGAVWGSLWVNEKSNAALLKAKGIATDFFSKVGHDTGSENGEKRKLAKLGYWLWHGSIEAFYLATAAAIACRSDWQQSAGFQMAANAVATAKLLGQAGITQWAASKERRQQNQIPETQPQSQPDAQVIPLSIPIKNDISVYEAA